MLTLCQSNTLHLPWSGYYLTSSLLYQLPATDGRYIAVFTANFLTPLSANINPKSNSAGKYLLSFFQQVLKPIRCLFAFRLWSLGVILTLDVVERNTDIERNIDECGHQLHCCTSIIQTQQFKHYHKLHVNFVLCHAKTMHTQTLENSHFVTEW